LDRFGEELENVVNLVLETSTQHLIGLVKEELTNRIQTQSTTVDHIKDTTWGTNDNVDSSLEGTNVVTDGGSSDARVDLNVHVVSQGDDNLLNLLGQLTSWGKNQSLAFAELGIKGGKSTDGKGGSFTL
jgi:hypothetical protein